MSFLQYLKDTRGELHHVAWPTRMQTIVYTIIVIALSLFYCHVPWFLRLYFYHGPRSCSTISPAKASVLHLSADLHLDGFGGQTAGRRHRYFNLDARMIFLSANNNFLQTIHSFIWHDKHTEQNDNGTQYIRTPAMKMPLQGISNSGSILLA